MSSRIWLSPPHMSGYEQEFIDTAFKNNYVAPVGSNIDGFEKDLEDYLEDNSFVAVTSSGTAAIHLALISLGIKPGDEVICQTKTFVASVNPITYLGATPVFVDSDLETWNMCPILLEKAIKDRMAKGSKPKAIVVINLYGMPYKVNEIQAISRSYGIPVVEDSAEALGSNYFGKKCGTFGTYSIFSFNGNKIITTSGGGAFISRTKEGKDHAIYLATQAKEAGLDYSHSTVGYNYRMSNICAGIGRGQMKVLMEHVELRRRNYQYYKESFKSIPSITFQDELDGFYSNRWLTCVLFDSQKTRDEIHSLLSENNIESRPSWKPMHLQPLYQDKIAYLNGNAEDFYKRGLCLPSGSNLSLEDLQRITSIIKNYF